MCGGSDQDFGDPAPAPIPIWVGIKEGFAPILEEVARGVRSSKNRVFQGSPEGSKKGPFTLFSTVKIGGFAVCSPACRSLNLALAKLISPYSGETG